MAERTCPTCGASFIPTYWAQKFCPPTDVDRARITARGTTTQVRSRCAKRYQNARSRGTIAKLVDLPPIEPFACEQCGVRCVQGENVAPHATRFCGYDCKATWHHSHRPRSVLHCFPEAPPDPLRGEDVKGYFASMLKDPCVYCGGPVSGVDHIVPSSSGGADDWTNCAAACRNCNGRKGITPLIYFLCWDATWREFEPWRQVVRHLYRRRQPVAPAA